MNVVYMYLLYELSHVKIINRYYVWVGQEKILLPLLWTLYTNPINGSIDCAKIEKETSYEVAWEGKGNYWQGIKNPIEKTTKMGVEEWNASVVRDTIFKNVQFKKRWHFFNSPKSYSFLFHFASSFSTI